MGLISFLALKQKLIKIDKVLLRAFEKVFSQLKIHFLSRTSMVEIRFRNVPT